ncbi:cold-inducible protein YdjO-related protein [Bacillus massilinigeriensis]|uniref:cold-inducible protein YdjO-related protein n=1 Tax=Bacillus massilionigeriensis TaxID=1805475 RepID=UPI000A05C64A|nr:cold-inducible protein YdjO-related protein [Bacillus massilionigeriensis]
MDIKGALPIFFNKKGQDDKPEMVMTDVEVYSCMDDNCNGWMRKEFASNDLKCPLCGNETSMEIRELPKI